MRAGCGEVHYRGRICPMVTRAEDQCAWPWTNTPAARLPPHRPPSSSSPRASCVLSISLASTWSLPRDGETARHPERQRDDASSRSVLAAPVKNENGGPLFKNEEFQDGSMTARGACPGLSPSLSLEMRVLGPERRGAHLLLFLAPRHWETRKKRTGPAGVLSG